MSVVTGAQALLEGVGVLALLERLGGTGGIVTYHGVAPQPTLTAVHVSTRGMEQHLEFLAARFRVIPLREFVARGRNGRSLRGCAAITFDDAYEGVRDHALPLLARRGLPATVFVVSAHSPAGTPFWWDRVAWAMDRAPASRLGPLLSALTGRAAAPYADVLMALLSRWQGLLPPDAEVILTELEREIGRAPERPLAEAGLRELTASGLIELGCHTVTHPCLPALPADAQRTQIADSLRWLRDRFANALPFLAYPYGLYTSVTVAAARDAGIEAAFSVAGLPTGPRFDPWTCPRIGLAEVNTRRTLRWRMAWACAPLLARRYGGRHPRWPMDRLPAGA